MKIKVDKDEWDGLLERVSALEDSDRSNWQYHRYLVDNLQEMMESYFRNKVQTYIVKRDKEMIIAELKEEAMNNLFKEEDE